MRRQTWFAILVCCVGVVPGFFIGGFLKILMFYFGGWANGSDFLYLRAIFGIETPNLIYQFVFVALIPNLLQAIVAGGIGVWLMDRFANGADARLAATVTGALFAGFMACVVLLSLSRVGLSGDLILAVIQVIGLWIGLVAASANLVPSRRAVA